MNETLKLGLILFIITAVSASVLAVSNNITSPKIAEADRIADQKAKAEILPQGDEFRLLSEEKFNEIKEEYPNVTEIFEAYKGEKLVGYTIKNISKGYGGDIEIMTGISTDGMITGIKILNHSETPGLGANLTKPHFINSFKNKPIDKELVASKSPENDNEIQALTSATITTNAVLDGVNVAREIYNLKLAD
ncbi:RnfABCDGE type electron transport complex subunit G [Caproiciproducens sp. MSJ-32]|uniref:RnfABCDGE type electron transport complex subunit G n=1 Tax=Caproiciproducens sp. MSJ-32 TaxID=2841527 RepID=UPI001C127AF5|nr:RnfABCDGE type electron transport complex subunit G [Caproiciproducens sp. MSJ-32]MBU5455439.1 RnfABCDGE type electron transport complex subunit G [Caproiciproducens sp. MSJ-32]